MISGTAESMPITKPLFLKDLTEIYDIITEDNIFTAYEAYSRYLMSRSSLKIIN